MKYFKLMVCMLMLMTLTLPVMASSPGGNTESKEMEKTSDMVLGHIKDSYNWHVTDIGEKKIIIPLPIIVHSSTGWHVFSSLKFAEEPDSDGYRRGPFDLAIATKEPHEGKIVELHADGQVSVPFDVSITKTVAVMMIDSVILCLCILIPARWYRRHKASDYAPTGFTGLVEILVTYVEDEIVKPGVGEGYEKYSPYLMTCFFFILTCNLMGIVPFPPGGGNVTGNITVTFFLAFCTFVITQFSGTKHYFKDIFWPDVPLALKAFPLIPIIEFVGVFTKPFALMIRLFANMMAGHAIAVSLTSIIFVVAAIGGATFYGMSALSILMSVFMMLLEIVVCFVQAMVFTILSAIFIGMARAKSE